MSSIVLIYSSEKVFVRLIYAKCVKEIKNRAQSKIGISNCIVGGFNVFVTKLKIFLML